MDLGFGAPVGHVYERWLLRRYAHRLILSNTRRGRIPPRRPVAGWLLEHGSLLSVRSHGLEAPEGGERLKPAEWKRFASHRTSLARALDEAPPAPSSLERRLAWLAKALGLSTLDHALVGVMARSALSRPLRDLIQRCEGYQDGCWYDEETRAAALAALIATPLTRVRERLQGGAPLALYGLVEDRGSTEFALSRLAMSIVRSPSSDDAALRRKLLGARAPSGLAWTDFAHIEGREIALNLLNSALEQKARGISLLFYGPPGAGKTEFARALGDRLRAHAVFAGERNPDGQTIEPTRSERIGAVALTDVLAHQAGKTFVVVDEADDIFTGVDVSDAAARKGSKAFMNRFVENCEAPTIWITNSPARLGPATLRRMSYVLRFPEPNRAVRGRIVDRIARRSKLKLLPNERDALVALNASPALLANALRTAKLTGAPASACAKASLRAIGGRAPADIPAPFVFDASLICADHDLLALREKIVRCGTLALSFCFHGAPGSGKSAFARHLAQEMELEILEKRASDLLSKWLGGTERAIREAFEEASDRRAFLIFDEADSLLASRAGAQRSWEVTQVNELLVAMERHALPFACSTNAFEQLDGASLRRFLFKVKFLPMGREQIGAAFRAAFGLECPPDLLSLDNLTPGDFALVARKAQVLGAAEKTTLAGWLRAEAMAKPEARRRPIGF